jgi:hypothetical protein
MRVDSKLLCLLGSVLGLAVISPEVASAQRSGDGFLFQPPLGSLVLRGGFHHASAGSDLFSFTTEQLTVRRSDFGGPMVGLDLSVFLHPRFDLSVGAGSAASQNKPEVRGGDDLPIEQTTRFERVPLTASLKAYLTPRGRSIGQFAWVPKRYAPFVGAGGGMMWYRFAQEGEFVDFQTLEIFRDDLRSSGWAPTAHVLAGLDFSLTPRLVLTAEARHSWAKADLQDAFEEFQPIDLSGLAASLGIQVRF